MKKILAIILIVLSFSACENAREKADEIVTDVQEGTEKLVKTVGEVKDKTIETVSDIENAVDKVKEAQAAVEEVTN